MSLFDDHDPDPRDRPRDPAGTQPKVDPKTLRLGGSPYEPPDRDAVDDGLETAIERLEELDEEAPGPDGLPVRSAQTPRFQFLLGALLAVGLIAVAGVVAVVLAGKDDPAPKVAWSAWAPASADPVAEIAAYVGPRYRQGKEQLALVTGGGLAYKEQAATPVLKDPASGDVAAVPGVTAMYTLCGTATGCAFPGTPSTQRGLLVGREALELALYTLHYVSAAQNVAVLLPSAKDAKTTTTFFFTRATLARELARPLSESLSASTPTVASVVRSPDAALVSQVTTPALFDASFETSSVIPPVMIIVPHAGP